MECVLGDVRMFDCGALWVNAAGDREKPRAAD